MRQSATPATQNAANDILIDGQAEGFVEVLAILGQPQRGLRRLNSQTAWISSAGGPFGPGLLLAGEE
jgi:hypothetical protein